MKWWRFLFAAWMLLSCINRLSAQSHRLGRCRASQPAIAQESKGVKRAIVIGVSEYEIYNQLPGAAPDALNVQDALTALDFERTVLAYNGTKLDKQYLVAKLREIASKCGEDDLLLIYFAGHGSRRQNRDYLLLSTTRQDNQAMFEATAFALGSDSANAPADSLEGILKHCKARRRVIIVDACRNTTTRDAAPATFPNGLDPKFMQRMDQVVRAAPDGREVQGAVLYACSPGETSKEDIARKAGIFTLPLAAALKGEARDREGRVTLGNVLAYVKRAIPLDDNGKPVQTPVLYGDHATAMVLGVLRELKPGQLSRSIDRVDGENGKVEMVWVEGAKEFQVGTSDQEAQNLLAGTSASEREHLAAELEKERTGQKVSIPGFWIDCNLVTVKQFARFREAMKATNTPINWPKAPDCPGYKNWSDGDLPMVNVPATVAEKYAKWVGGDLPTEAEWELAARGPQRRIYPWGDRFDSKLAHSSVGGAADGPAKPGNYPGGISIYGVNDMSGNLWQWCHNTAAKWCLHGGSWKETDPLHLRSAYCNEDIEDILNDDVIGFRIVIHGNPPVGN